VQEQMKPCADGCSSLYGCVLFARSPVFFWLSSYSHDCVQFLVRVVPMYGIISLAG